MKKLFAILLLIISAEVSSLFANDGAKDLHRYITKVTYNYSAGKDSAAVNRRALIGGYDISRFYLKNFADISLDVNSSKDIDLKLSVRVISLTGNNYYKTIDIDTVHFNTVLNLDSISKGAAISSFSVYVVSEGPVGLHYSLESEVKIWSAIFSWRALFYIFIVILTSGGILYTIKWEKFCLFAAKSWNDKWKTGISIFSQFFLILLVIDEIGLLLNEWHIHSVFFSFIRNLMELPGITQIIFLANIALIIPAGYMLSKGILLQIRENNKEHIPEWVDFNKYCERYSAAISVFLFIITILFFLLQCVVFNEFNLDGGNGLIFIIFLLFLLCGPFIVLFRLMPLMRRIYKENNPFRRHPWYLREDIFFTLLICFISLTQTMITKVILLLVVVEWARPLILKLTSLLTGRTVNKVYTIEENAYGSLINSISSTTLIEKWNFIFLTVSFLPLILVFQIHNSPYPPSDSAFPKTETVSALYMFYMILFLFISRNRNHIKLKSAIWFLCTVFIIYLTPVLFPSWYFPSVVPPGFSPLEAVSMISTTGASVILFFFFHLLVSFVFLLNHYIAGLKQKLLDLKYQSSIIFRRYFLLSICGSYIIAIIFPVLILILSTSPAVSSMKFVSSNGIFQIKDTEIINDLLIILLPSLILIYIVPGIKRGIKGMKESALEFGGEDAVTFLENNFPFIKSFREWNGKKSSHGSHFVFVLPIIVFLILNSLLLFLPGLMHEKHTKLLWLANNNNENRKSSGRILKVDESILYITSVSVRSYNSSTGELNWENLLNPYDATLAGENKLCIVTARDILLLNSETGQQLWKSEYSMNDPVLPDYPQLLIAGNNLAIKLKDTLSVYSKFSGEKIGGPFLTKGPAPVILGGNLLWITDSDSLVKWDQNCGCIKLSLVEDSIRELISLPGHTFISKGQGIISIDETGKREWTKNIEQDEYVNDVFICDSLAIFDMTNGLFACSIIDGSTIWERPGLHFGNLDYDMFSGNKYANAINKQNDCIITVNEKDVFLLEISNGNSIREFVGAKKANSFFENYSVGISGNVLCTFDPIRMEVFSLDKGKMKFRDFYVADVINKRTLFFRNNSSGLKASVIIFENDTIFLSNDYGLFALRLKH